MLKKLSPVVFGAHSLVIVLVLWSDLAHTGEDYSWALAFFLDFPVSIGFHGLSRLVSAQLFTAYIFLLHLVLGGLWWIAIVQLFRWLITKIRK
jgi:hypothetical protein